jgi:hypothetical protein
MTAWDAWRVLRIAWVLHVFYYVTQSIRLGNAANPSKGNNTHSQHEHNYVSDVNCNNNTHGQQHVQTY